VRKRATRRVVVAHADDLFLSLALSRSLSLTLTTTLSRTLTFAHSLSLARFLSLTHTHSLSHTHRVILARADNLFPVIAELLAVCRISVSSLGFKVWGSGFGI